MLAKSPWAELYGRQPPKEGTMTTETHTEYTYLFDGAPSAGRVFTSPEAVNRYLASAKLLYRNDPEHCAKYGPVVSRRVTTTTTHWEV
jgi:hypothetical protein